MKLDENEVWIVDALFHEMAKQSGGLSVEDWVNGSWDLFERGCLRLVDDGKHMGIEPCDGNRAERRTQRTGRWLNSSARWIAPWKTPRRP